MTSRINDLGRPARMLPAIAIAIALSACGGGDGGTTQGQDTPGGGPSVPGATSPTTGGGARCAPEGTTVQISAKDQKFDTECLAAPADTAFTIEFDNQEAMPHNVAIYRTEAASDEIFRGETITGPKKTTYNVDAQPAGDYYFRCDVHPDMDGRFIVE